MSAASVSRTGLPFSQLSATASMSWFFSTASAIALSTFARSVADASPQASFAVESATSVIGPAVAGAKSTRYLPCVGANHLPPMKFSYLGSTETMLPGRPGGTYFISWLLQGISDDQQGKPSLRGRTGRRFPVSALTLHLKLKTSNLFLENRVQ